MLLNSIHSRLSLSSALNLDQGFFYGAGAYKSPFSSLCSFALGWSLGLLFSLLFSSGDLLYLVVALSIGLSSWLFPPAIFQKAALYFFYLKCLSSSLLPGVGYPFGLSFV